MENFQVTTESTASQVLASDMQELSLIMNDAITPLTQMTPVELSKNTDVREKAQEAVDLASNILAHVNQMLSNADALAKITKPVHFQNNAFKPSIQAYRDGVAVIGENGAVTADAILNCDFLFIGNVDAAYDSAHVTVCKDVHIVLASDELHAPSHLVFWSGGTYHLYHGHSLSMCNNLSRTTTLNLI